jgi:hypothetical protein
MFGTLSFDFWLGGLYGDSVVDLLEQASPEAPATCFLRLEIVPVPHAYAPWPRLEVA